MINFNEPIRKDRYEDPRYDTTFDERLSDWEDDKKKVERWMECLIQQTIDTALAWLPTPTRRTEWLEGALRDHLLSKEGFEDLCTGVFDNATVDGLDWDALYKIDDPEPKLREDERED